MPGRKNDRIKRVKSRLSRAGVEAFLFTDHSDIRYLSGFYMPPVVLLVARRGKSLYIASPMNLTLAKKMLKGRDLEVVPSAKSMTASLARYTKDLKIRRLGFIGGSLSVADYKQLSRMMPGTKMKDLPSLLEEMRKVKSPEEIRILRKAAKETVRIWRKAAKKIKEGMSEKEIATMIDVIICDSGYRNSFPTIAAIGENSADPHAVPMGRRLKKGEHLLVDFGIRLDGYCSDLTRIWAGGRIIRKIEEFRKHVRKAQDQAIKKIKPGYNIGSLAKEVNTYFKNNNVDKYVCHGLGHGVGLDIHEGPFLHGDSKEMLKKGMVLTVEPGLYIPGVGGVREEDMVLVTKGGCEVLTR